MKVSQAGRVPQARLHPSLQHCVISVAQRRARGGGERESRDSGGESGECDREEGERGREEGEDRLSAEKLFLLSLSVLLCLFLFSMNNPNDDTSVY